MLRKPAIFNRKSETGCDRLPNLSDSPIVLGGAGYSMFPESALAYLDADYGVAGEGEIAFPDLVRPLAKQ